MENKNDVSLVANLINKKESFYKLVFIAQSIIIALLILLVGYMYYQNSQYAVLETTEYTQDGEWNAIADDGSIINGDGDKLNGETNKESN